MPFGLMNVSATFQCLMETYLGNLQFQWCIIYLDDVTIFAATLKEHLKRLCTVLSWLQEARLKLQPAKCEFFKASVAQRRVTFSATDGRLVQMATSI